MSLLPTPSLIPCPILVLDTVATLARVRENTKTRISLIQCGSREALMDNLLNLKGTRYNPHLSEVEARP